MSLGLERLGAVVVISALAWMTSRCDARDFTPSELGDAIAAAEAQYSDLRESYEVFQPQLDVAPRQTVLGWFRTDVGHLKGVGGLELVEWKKFPSKSSRPDDASRPRRELPGAIVDRLYSFDGSSTLVLDRLPNAQGELVAVLLGGSHREWIPNEVKTPHELTWYVSYPKSSFAAWIQNAAASHTQWKVEDQHSKDVEGLETVKRAGVQGEKPRRVEIRLWIAPLRNFIPVKVVVVPEVNTALGHAHELSELRQLPNGLWYAGRITVTYGHENWSEVYDVRSASTEKVTASECHVTIPPGTAVKDQINNIFFRTPKTPATQPQSRPSSQRVELDRFLKEAHTASS